MTDPAPNTALAARLLELSVKSTQDPLNEDGRYFNGDWHKDLTQCSHGDTGNYANRSDGQFIAALWNAFRNGQIITIAEHEAIIVTRTPTHAPNAGAVKVKPLVWVPHPSVPIWRCDTMVGTYKVFAMEPFPTWDFDSATDPKDKLSTRAETPEAAKSAAQAHHDAAIRAEIILTPDPRDEVIALALAACRIIDAAVAEGHQTLNDLLLHLLASVTPARAALAAAKEFMK